MQIDSLAYNILWHVDYHIVKCIDILDSSCHEIEAVYAVEFVRL